MSRELFETFRAKIAIDNSDEIATTYGNITKCLNKEFYGIDSDTRHSRQVGSYGRHTAIKGISDLDMIFELPSELYNEYNRSYDKPQYKLLAKVKNTLAERYPNTVLRVDGQIVSLKFKKYLVELVPAFRNTDGSYTNPDTNNGGSWENCNPVAEKKAINIINNEHNRNPKNLAKMIRSWKNTHGVPMSGMLIDTLVYRFFQQTSRYKNVKFGSYKYLVFDFFEFLVSLDPSKEYWRAPGSNSHVYKKGKFIPKAKKALRKCHEAINNEQIAHEKWREVFGKRFPQPQVAKAALESHDAESSFSDYEQSIEDLYPLNISYDLELDANIEEGNKVINLMSLLTNKIKKDVRIHFIVNGLEDIPSPHEIYWKVRNVGPEAQRRNMLRGQIFKGKKHHDEKADFDGPHYVECYVVKDGFCVARASIPVPI
ncbi:SMODS domain-containing nucleotidyltransferase [Vreelandella venusta]|uniref:Nucleotidyltransferase n=1 Tax=Vreelandella venusta TaxID=44935 RepID=A0ABX2BDD0_9GAMM|nr:nucleotidyltransferase [Halomonas venusta]AZM96093.1 nucleotidyltransferase [Halomonas venusta]NPT30615.1 nucleotidyltransferase [Halomonas venusta]